MQAAGEADLRALARAFASAEARVRDLVAQAVEGNRRELLTEALAVLLDLRRPGADEAVEKAYRAALSTIVNTRSVTSRRGDVRRVRDLAGALSLKLSEGVRTADNGSREAFRRVTADNLEDTQHQAVTAYDDEAGKRWTLGGYAGMLTTTIGRQATSRGTVDGVGAGLVLVEGSSNDSICGPLIGNTYPAASAPQPPFHVGCSCLLASTS